MRQARFSGLNDGGAEPARLSLAALLAFDLRLAAHSWAQQVAAERARCLAVAVPLLGAWHLLWMALLVHGLWAAGTYPLASALPLPLAAILALDLGLALALRAPRLPAHRQVWLMAAHGAATGGLWIAAALIAAAAPAGGSMAVRAALVAGAGSGLPAFFLVPALAFLGCGVAWLAGLALGVAPPLLVVGAALGVVLLWLSLFRAHDQIAAAHRRILLETQVRKAARFVNDFEASGRGWFWETNAEGQLTYVSGQLAARLGLDGAAMLGTRFEDVLFARDADHPLSFHLTARFPFTEVMVRARDSDEIWWSLSGSPNFDEYGRFLGFRGLGANVSEQQRGEAETRRLATIDSLTNLPNRATMRATLDAALANADERRRGCALFTIDLDRFKQVNDTLGHPVGDKLLRKVAERLTAAIGPRGQVGRLGGDEFEAVLPGIDAQGTLAELAGGIISEISRPYVIDGHRIEIGASVGIAVAWPGKTHSAALIRDADLALYAAKADGRGTFRFFVPEMHAETADRQMLGNDLREALGKGQLRLFYQPIVDSVSEEVLAFEALLRWQHPTRGLLTPDLVIPLAEENGLMPAIGDWVLRTACADAARWPDHIRVAVNLSPAELADPALPATVTATVARAGLDPDRLELEVCEAVFLDSGGTTDARLRALKRIGVRLALDNFGTGQVGLAHLRTAPLDKIKIDRSFVEGAAAPGSRNGAIVRGIVVLAESLGMDTTAEGVEAPAEVNLVRRLGCSQVQGFLFGRPMPAERALELALASRPTAELVGFARPPRHRLIRNGRLHWDGCSVAVRLRNISERGAMIECDSALAAGTPVSLDLDDAGTVAAQIRWQERGQMGLMFDQPFNLARLARSALAPVRGAAMVVPEYLKPGAERVPEPAAADSPLAVKRRSAARR